MNQPFVWLLLAVLLLSTSACATPAATDAWYAALVDADRHFDHGRFAEAEAAYAALVADVPSNELHRYLRLRRAAIALEGDTPTSGLAELEALAAETAAASDDAYDAWGAQALELAAAYHDEQGHRDEATATRVRLIVRFPESSAALDALEQLIRQHAARSPAEAVQWLAESYPSVAGTELADNVLYAMARLLDTELGEAELALAAYLRLSADDPFSPLRDDSLYRAAELAARLGRPDDALAYWERIAAVHDSSWALGEYDSSLRDDAMLARAELLASLARYVEAKTEYVRLLDAYPEHLHAARYHYDYLRFLCGHGDGDAATVREALLKQHPESVYSEKVRAWGGDCPEGE